MGANSLPLIVLINFCAIIAIDGRLLLPIPSRIDRIRSDYLHVEKNLWQFIEHRQSDADTNYVLEQVHSRHDKFLRSDFNEKNVPLTYFDTRHTELLDATQTVKSAADMALQQYLHNDSSKFNQYESLVAARHQSHLIKEFDTFHNACGLSDFFGEIRSVSAVGHFISFTEAKYVCVCVCLSFWRSMHHLIRISVGSS